MKLAKNLELSSVVLFLSLFSWNTQAFFFTQIPRVVRTPDSRFEKLESLGYPWSPNYLDLNIAGLPTLRMHYLDLGSKTAAETLLLLHGTPSWSFIFRKMIPPLLAAGYRVVVPDFIGFGKSDKLTNRNEYSHDLHVQSLLKLVQFLDLQAITLWGHDLGGPVGLSVARKESVRFNRFILYNTWIPQGDMLSTVQSTIAHAGYLAYRATTTALGMHHPVGIVFSAVTTANRAEVGGYTAPFPSSLYKGGPASWPVIVPITFGDPMAVEMRAVKKFLVENWTGPVLFGYSSRELFTVAEADLFRDVFRTNGCEVPVEDAGHFLQEDQGQNLAQLTITFVTGGCAAVI